MGYQYSMTSRLFPLRRVILLIIAFHCQSTTKLTSSAFQRISTAVNPPYRLPKCRTRSSNQPSVSDFYDDYEDSDYRAPYIPPEITIEDDDDDDNDNNDFVPFITSATKGHTDDPYTLDESAYKSPSRPKRPKRPDSKSVVVDMAGTNWMQKNAKFMGNSEDTNLVDNDINNSNNRHSAAAPRKINTDSFQSTRVFVQGIPNHASWQDLKDHFKVAGNVVFASVSVDPQTGESKGYGIVQYETADMAQTALAEMRNHPLFGEYSLYVRADVQEKRDGDSRQHDSRKKGPTPPTKWKCANEDNVAYLSDEDLMEIRRLLKDRDFARRQKKYELSDRIRDDLKERMGVYMDDRLKLWWTSIDDGRTVPKSIQSVKGEGRWGRLKEWRQIPTTPDNDACVDFALVDGLLKQRDIARREKDFNTADTLLEQARTAPDGDLTLRIHDESRTWRIWTDVPPPAPTRPQQSHQDSVDRSDPEQMRQKASEACLTIVREYAPNKIEEIETVLEKYPGREFQVLKRLKQQYLAS